MSQKLGKARAFRQWLRNQERLERLDELGINCSEVTNQALDEYLSEKFKSLIEQRIKQLEKALSVPVP